MTVDDQVPPDPRLDAIVDLIVELASGELSVRGKPSPARDTIDAVIVGINLMADELQLVYAELEARVAERTSALEQAQSALQAQALTDALTGLANRTLLAGRLAEGRVGSGEDGYPTSVILLDLDEFKLINDSLGHGVGDQVLVVVAQRLRSLVRDSDTVARLGGDEFAIVLQDVPEEYALQVAQRAVESLQVPIRVENRELSVRASVGVRFGRHDQHGDDLLRDADIAMYEAKARGKGTVQVFEPSMHQASNHRLRILTELTAAMQDELLVVHYQPIVRLADGLLVGAEALLRWRHPELGDVSPALFISIAEESGRIEELGEWALGRALDELQRWLEHIDNDRDFTLHVNLSAAELRRNGLVRMVQTGLARRGIRPGRLAVEVSESSLLKADAREIETLRLLRDSGVAVHIDDFGSGYSSIASLRRLPLDAVKVDPSLAGAVTGSKRDRDFVRAVVDLITAVGLRVIVEGIETPQQLAGLREIGAEYGQGFHFGAAVIGAELLDRIRWTGTGTSQCDRGVADRTATG